MSDLQCPATILVVRHGESRHNVERRLSAAVPGEPLTEQGRGQVAAMAERLRHRGIARVYVSPLLRAQQTGQLLATALGVGLGTLDGVREISMGRYESSTAEADWAHVDAAFLGWLGGDLTGGIDGGESGLDVVHRMRAELELLADLHRGETIVVVSHGGAMSVALPHCADNVSDDYADGRYVPNCGLVEFSIDSDGWRLVQWPGDPDRAPHPGDLVDLVGRAEAQHARSLAAVEVAGVPCTRLAVDTPWATRATLTERAEPPGDLDVVLAWLEAARPGRWQVRARAEQVDALPPRLVPVLHLGVWLTDGSPRYTVPEGCEVGPARDRAEFLAVYGKHLAPVLGERDGLLVLRAGGATVACARIAWPAGTAYVSGVTVRPEQRGRGFGRLMSAAAIDHGGVRVAGVAWLHCEDRLAGLYAPLGLRRITTHVDLEMRWHQAAGAGT